MTKFEIEISRGVLRVETITVQVDAANLDQAEKKAFAKAKRSPDDKWDDCTWDDGSKWNYQYEGGSEIKEKAIA